MNGPQSGDRVSEYRLDERLSVGGGGDELWTAHHHVWTDRRVVARLIVEPLTRSLGTAPGMTFSRLNSPNIVKTVGIDPFAPAPYVISEFVDGLSLDALVRRFPQGLPLPAIESIAKGILRALDHAHTHGVAHGGLRPTQVLIAEAHKTPTDQISVESVKVTGFGEGRAADPRGDLYSFAVMLFAMATGRTPDAEQLPSQFRPGLPGWVDSVYLRCHAPHDRRLVNANDVLQWIGRDATPTVPPPPPRPNMPGSRCRACGSGVDAEDNYCMACGSELKSLRRKCPSCSGVPGRDDQYCVLCGSPLPAEIG